MTFVEYNKKVKGSLAAYMKNLDTDDLYMQFALGLYEETGEVVSPIRRTIKGNYHQTPIDPEHLKEEIGDVLWYISHISDHLPGISLEEVVGNNLKKTHIIYQNENNLPDVNMDINLYAQDIRSTYREDLPEGVDERATYFCLGLTKEVGEICRLFGEHGIDQTRLDIYKAQEKLGDTLWYLTAICNTYDISLEDVAKENIFKVSQRYDANGMPVSPAKQTDCER